MNALLLSNPICEYSLYIGLTNKSLNLNQEIVAISSNKLAAFKFEFEYNFDNTIMESNDFINPNLYNSEVEVLFKSGSLSFAKFGNRLIGLLAGRVIEELFDKERPGTQIIGVIIKTFNHTLTIPVDEIQNIDRATYQA